ncbi:flagellar export protein FliJ [Rouxiella sp. WC2420]|uniref:Flagellar export protein FliJ n=1 Tax=Rouxiella sp. WC2420 TaxID=3234145 RepID=A0AB39VSF4_9GAMM
MDSNINTLHHLQQMRVRAVEKLVGQVGQQKQQCQRFQKNVSALTGLYDNTPEAAGDCAVLMNNQSRYKHHLQRIVDWQKQEQILAEKQLFILNKQLLVEACKEKAVDVLLAAQRLEYCKMRDRKEQKLTDAASVQCWLRQRSKIL